MSEIKVDTIGPRVDNGTLTIGASGDTVNIAGTAGTGFPAGTALTGSTNNTITTVTGASAIQGEANLTYDGSNLGVNIASPTMVAGTGMHLTSAGSDCRFHISNNTVGNTASDGGYLFMGSNGALGLLNKENAGVNIYTNSTESWEFDSAGNLLPKQASKGVYLGVTAATASNLLDDYEEGSFTPTWAVSSGAIAQPNSNDARYTKVGNKVTIQFATDEISQTSTMGAAAYYKITNLPFTVQTNTAGSGGIKEVGQTGRGFILWAGGNSTTANMYRTDTVVLPNAYLQGSFTYIAN